MKTHASTPRRLRWVLPLLVAPLLLVGTAPPATAQDDGDRRTEEERRAEQARRGAGLRVGAWVPGSLNEPSGASTSQWPHLEGWFQRGLDRHIAIESTVSIWRRNQESSTERAATYIVPLFTAIKFYPGTGPEDGVQPYILGGGGFGLGIDDREGTSGGLLGVGATEGTRMFVGLGFKGGAGMDVRLGDAFGLTAGGRYQWIRFDGQPGGNQTYRGPVFDVGLTYRFQY